MVLFASVVALVPFGILREDRVLLVAGTAGLLLLGMGLMLTTASSVWVWLVTRSGTQARTELRVGTPGRSGFVLRTPIFLPLVDVRWTITEPVVDLKILAAGRDLVEQWTPHRRGECPHIVRWFTAGDAFGLTALSFPVRVEAAIRFVPDEGALRQVAVVRGLASGDQFAHPEGRPEGDLQDIRSYGAGDPIRFILWKVFAKSRTLVVRSPERALSPIRRTAAFLVATDGDQAAAGTAKTAFECGALGEEWRFGADGSDEVAKESRSALGVVMASAVGSPEAAGAGLAKFIAAADNPRRVVIFAPAVPGPWVNRVLAVAQSTRLEVVLCADRITPPTGIGLGALLFESDHRQTAGEVVVSRAALADLCKQLAGVGEVRVVDRKSGHVFGQGHLARLTRAR